jgi:hypothetical protein
MPDSLVTPHRLPTRGFECPDKPGIRREDEGMTESPAWLGDLEGTGEGPPKDPDEVVERREAVALPPDDQFPLWPAGALDPPAPAPAAAPVPAPAERSAEPAGIGVIAVVNRRPVRPPAAPKRTRGSRRAQRPRRPATGLLALILFGLMSAFFAWVTAEPLWLAIGHAQRGTVTVTACTHDRCVGTFTGDGVIRVEVPVMGKVPPLGGAAPAVMTSARGSRAYVDTAPVGRALAGLAALLLCGAGIAWGTGARRVGTARERRLATALSLSAPAALLAATLTTTF